MPQGEKKIIVKKCLDEVLALPVGSVLLRINDELIAPDAVDDTLRSLQAWSTSSATNETLRLRFFIKRESTSANAASSQQIEDSGDPVRNIFIRDITQRARAHLGIDLCTPYIKTLCSMNRYIQCKPFCNRCS